VATFLANEADPVTGPLALVATRAFAKLSIGEAAAPLAETEAAAARVTTSAAKPRAGRSFMI
jgi:hypothetical protein